MPQGPQLEPEGAPAPGEVPSVSCEVPSVSGHPEIVQDRSQHILREQPTHRSPGPAPLPRASVSPVLTGGLDSGVNPFSTEVCGSPESQGWPGG